MQKIIDNFETYFEYANESFVRWPNGEQYSMVLLGMSTWTTSDTIAEGMASAIASNQMKTATITVIGRVCKVRAKQETASIRVSE